jgi:hypothetical protein
MKRSDYICGSYDWTGGITYVDLAAVRCTEYDRLTLNPLDAPIYLPAGSCNSAEYRNWGGDFLVGQTSILRD